MWSLLGDVEHYVEPFAGSLAVLLNRPHLPNRTYHSETVGDLDGLLVNAWLAIQQHPHEVAEAASQPVAEALLHHIHIALVDWRNNKASERVGAIVDGPDGRHMWCDPQIAGWWLWGIACWIGSGWCHGANGPWWEDNTGRLVKRERQPGEPGVKRQRPHLGDNGQGVNRPQLRKPGVKRQRPHLGNNGQGVNRPQLRKPGGQWRDTVMPRLDDWIGALSARLRHVRILLGQWDHTITDGLQQRTSWGRLLTNGASKTLSVRQGGHAGVFLDPPYAASADRKTDLYAIDSLQVAHEVADWALEHGNDPKLRIVVAGFDGEHADRFTSAGWREVEWFTAGWLTGGMGNTGTDAHQQKRERLWASPHCLRPEDTEVAQSTLFDT